MMDVWRELLGAALAVWDGLVAAALAACSNVVEAAGAFRLTPAIENALIAWAVVCGAGMFVAAALAARQGRRG